MGHSTSKPLLIRDEIHGDMAFEGIVRTAIDHPSFQRLRYIKQLGLAEYVFPCATHTRFQHSLGASFLAAKYFHNLFHGWLAFPDNFRPDLETTTLFAKETKDLIRSVAKNQQSYQYWLDSVSLAALLHDVGHGPWSHTFEELRLPQDFSQHIAGLGPIRTYFEGLTHFDHEDVSILYLSKILSALDANQFFLPVAGLISKRLAQRADWESSCEEQLKTLGIVGGVSFHKLLRPIISGPFDVDRIDYIQRDGKNCGVNIGAIEWNRLLTKLISCLAKHPPSDKEPSDLVLLSNLKNHHVLDDFVFSLFQMYAQVYLHPKIVGIEEAIRVSLRKRRQVDVRVTLEMHESLSDDRFRLLLKEDFGVTEISELLHRNPKYEFKVVSFPDDSRMQNELISEGYKMISLSDRPMMKDRLAVFLFHAPLSSKEKKYYLSPWPKTSVIADKIHSIQYNPRIWIRFGQ